MGPETVADQQRTQDSSTGNIGDDGYRCQSHESPPQEQDQHAQADPREGRYRRGGGRVFHFLVSIEHGTESIGQVAKD